MEYKTEEMINKQYLNDYTDFNNFLTLASKQVGLSEEIIEKDYWVTRILRNLAHSEFKDEFIFKGGTCLTKIWISSFGRFSEDIDLLLYLKETGIGKKKVKKLQHTRLQKLIGYISSLEGYNFDPTPSSSFEDTSSLIGGKFYFNYLGINSTNLPEYIKPQILIEPGYRGGIEPYSHKEINSIIGEYILSSCDNKLPEVLQDFQEDILPFSIKVLNPERIFLEKLDAIRNAFNRDELKASTRHYYDLYMLLQLEAVQALKDNNELLTSIITDISKISKSYYGLKNEITLIDFKDCAAFYRNFTGFEEVNKQYINEKKIYFKNQPPLEEILENLNNFLSKL